LLSYWYRIDSGDLLKREYPRYPRVAAGAVCFYQGKLLLIQRGNNPQKGRWTFPGGAVRVGESLADAARREVAEECGIVCKINDLIDLTEYIEPDETGKIQYHYIIADFLADYVAGELQAASDSTDARWFELSEVANLPTTTGLNKTIEKALHKRKMI